MRGAASTALSAGCIPALPPGALKSVMMLVLICPVRRAGSKVRNGLLDRARERRQVAMYASFGPQTWSLILICAIC